MTGEPNPPTPSTLPGTPDEKLALLFATLVAIFTNVLNALPIPDFLRRPLQARFNRMFAELHTRILNQPAPAPATEAKPAHPEPSISAPDSQPNSTPAPARAQRTTRAPLPASEPPPPNQTAPDSDNTESGTNKPDATKPPEHSIRPLDHPTRARRVTIPDRPPAQKFKKPACAAGQTHAHFVTIS